MLGRDFRGEKYRFGLQGWEQDNEISNHGNVYTTFYRLHASRICRTLSLDPKDQYSSSYIMLGNNPENGIDPDGAWFWEKSNIRQARAYAKMSGGKFEKWRGVDGEKNASVKSYNYTKGSGNSNLDGTEERFDDINLNVVNFKKGYDKSDLLMQSGYGYYKSKAAASTGMNRVKWALKGADAWINGWGKNYSGGQAPRGIKVFMGLNPIISATNSVVILSTEKDIYGMEASSKLDKGLAIAGLLTEGASTSFSALGKSSKTMQATEKINTGVQITNDVGIFDSVKTQKSDSNKND
jgi:hypothetical protein